MACAIALSLAAVAAHAEVAEAASVTYTAGTHGAISWAGSEYCDRHAYTRDVELRDVTIKAIPGHSRNWVVVRTFTDDGNGPWTLQQTQTGHAYASQPLYARGFEGTRFMNQPAAEWHQVIEWFDASGRHLGLKVLTAKFPGYYKQVLPGYPEYGWQYHPTTTFC